MLNPEKPFQPAEIAVEVVDVGLGWRYKDVASQQGTNVTSFLAF